MTGYVFTYGLLLPEAAEPAVLRDWRMEFAFYATVQRSPGSITVGGLIPVDEEKLAQMDAREGVPVFYRRERVLVAVRSVRFGTDYVSAWVYVMNDPRAGRPEQWYADLIREQYARLGHHEGPLDDALRRVGGTLECWTRQEVRA